MTTPGSSPSLPVRGSAAQVVRGLARRLSVPALERHHDRVHVVALFSFVNGCLAIAVMSAAAALTRQPLVFPSLGPTAFLLFHTPRAETASPRHTLAGHLIGVVAGYVSLVAFGLVHAPPALSHGVTWDRVGAAALSLGLTGAAMVLFGVPHAPACATTLIVSLGIVTTPAQLAVLMLAVVALLLLSTAILRLAGIDYPHPGPAVAPGSGNGTGSGSGSGSGSDPDG